MNRPLIASLILSLAVTTGCMAESGAPTDGDVRSTQQAVEGDPNGQTVPPVANSPLFAEFIAADKELDVQTCNIRHPGMLDPQNPNDWPCQQLYPNRLIEVVNVVVVNAQGIMVDNDIVADRPGGGCIHMKIPRAEAGGHLYIVAIGKHLDGSQSNQSQYYFFNMAI